MIGLGVRRDERLDPRPVTFRNFSIPIDLEVRVDDRRSALTALTRLGSYELTKHHDGTPTARMLTIDACVSRILIATMAPETNVSAATTTIAAL